MSRLFGPLSETTKMVSERACAFAEEKMAGAETADTEAADVAAMAVVDFRNSRRFIYASEGLFCVDLGYVSAKLVPACESLHWILISC
jgi:hypothetical protein